MEEIRFNSTLIILGNLLCGKDGILDSAKNVTWQHRDGQTKDEYLEELTGKVKDFTVIRGNYDLSGKRVLVTGSLFVYGGIIYDQNWEGRVVAWCM